MEFTWREEAPAAKNFGEGSVVVSAFPSAGLATTVAGHYMIRALGLPGSVDSSRRIFPRSPSSRGAR